MIKLAAALLIIFQLSVSWGQGATGGGLSPAEMNEFKNNLAEMEAKKNEELRKQQELKKQQEQQQQNKFTFPPSANPPPAQPNAAVQPPPVAPIDPNAPQPLPVAPVDPNVQPPPIAPAPMAPVQPVPPMGGGDLRSATIKPDTPLAPASDMRVKSPFMIPNELYIKIKKKIGEKPNTIDIDEAVEVRLRWPLKEYKLVGVIYDTRKPKAMIADREGKVHVYREKELIANGGGYVSEINNGEVIVVEKGAEVKLQLKER